MSQNNSIQKPLQIGLIGFGNVGQGLFAALQSSDLASAEIRKICIRDIDRPRPISSTWFTDDVRELLDDPSIDVIVELTDDPLAAWAYLQESLRQGKHFVTANKALVAEHLTEIKALEQQFDGIVRYEAACAGAVPVLQTLDTAFAVEPISGIRGILNGATNYVLGRTEAGSDFPEALLEAREAGFLESDPRLDLEGFDAVSKLSILLHHSYGLRVVPAEILRCGITGLDWPELRLARSKGWRIKLVAEAKVVNGQLQASVLPHFVLPDDPLHAVSDEFNALEIEGGFAGRQLLQGKGAGPLPTAAAVLSDLAAVREGQGYRSRKTVVAPQATQDFELAVYCRISGPIAPEGLGFSKLVHASKSGEFRYLLGTVSSHQLKAFFASPEAEAVSVVILPDGLEIESIDLDQLERSSEYQFLSQ